MEKIRESYIRLLGDVIPVRLAKLAPEFGIDPIPKADAEVPEGRLVFDPNIQKFVILFNRSHVVTAESQSKLSFVDLDPTMTRRLRFTYAHEFAHRFFFVKSGEAWKRALDVACDGLEPAKRNRELIRLVSAEEQLCNAVAGRILVPESDFMRHAAGLSCGESQSVAFGRKIRVLSECYQVSREAILVQLQRMWLRGASPTIADCCFLYLKYSNVISASRRKVVAARVSIGYVPKFLSGVELTPIFPGIRADNFGEEFWEALAPAMAGDSKGTGGISTSIILLDCKKNMINASFDGYYERAGVSTSPTLLVWGRIRMQ